MLPERRPRNTELDGLRGVAILLVIFHHWSGVALDPNGIIARLTALSWSGVDLFFVLSGFLIGGTLIDNRQSPTLFRTFYVRRACRIIPLYFVLLTSVGVLHFFLTQYGRWFYGPPLPWISYFTLTQNFLMVSRPHVAVWLLPTWSLAVEEHFYLTLPLLIRFTKIEWVPRVALAAGMAAPVMRIILYFTTAYASAASYVLLPCRADALMLGVLTADTQRHYPQIADRIARPAAVILSGIVLVLIWFSPDRTSPVMMTVGYTFIALFYAALLMVVTQGGLSFLRNSLLAAIGVRAYALYLFHVLIISFLRGNEPSTTLDPTATVESFIILLLLAMLSWKYLEKPLIDWGHRWKYAPAFKEDKTLVCAD